MNEKDFYDKAIELSKDKQLSISDSIEIVKASLIIDRLDKIYDILGYLGYIEEKIDRKEKKGDILRLGNLSLGYKTFLGKEAKKDDLEICQWDLKENYKWTIASFDYNEEYKCYELNSCLNRLNDKDIDWYDFGKLVQKGYEILGDLESD